MAHALTTNRITKKVEMAYVGETPWHGLGQALTAGAPIETWLDAAGMGWTVKTTPAKYLADGDLLVMPDKQVLYRNDTKDALGLVSNKYKVVQPREVLEFFRDLTEAHGFQLNTAGTLFGGKRFWALARTGKDFEVTKGDKVRGFLLLSTSCDGSLATTARLTSIRVVCNNTLSMATRGKADVSVRHATVFDAKAVKEQLGIITEVQSSFIEQVHALADKPLTAEQVKQFTTELLVDTQMVFKKDPTASTQHRKILELYNGVGKGSMLVGSKGTAWGLLNAVTEFVDHHARAKTTDARLASAWFGRGETLKQEAMERLLAL